MGGLVLDSDLELVRRYRSQNLAASVVTATVTDSNYRRGGFGCDVAEIYYAYYVKGEPFTGTHEKPFTSHNSGDDYLRHFHAGINLTVRVKPGDPSVSVANG